MSDRAPMDAIRSAREMLRLELEGIVLYMSGPWFEGMKRESERRTDAAYARFGNAVVEQVDELLELEFHIRPRHSSALKVEP